MLTFDETCRQSKIWQLFAEGKLNIHWAWSKYLFYYNYTSDNIWEKVLSIGNIYEGSRRFA